MFNAFNLNTSLLGSKAALYNNSTIQLFYAEVRRVLKPGGLYLFIEHVAAKGTCSSDSF